MRTLSHILGVGLVLLLVLAPTGCKSHKDEPEPPDTQRNPIIAAGDPAGGPPAANDAQRGAQRIAIENLMTNLYVYYTTFRDEKGHPPRTREEFKAYLETQPEARNLATALGRDWLVLRLDPPPGFNQVLAYEKDPYKKWNNRIVLKGGGAVKMMDDPEFQAALKAQ